jgi:hypothetical protein
LVWREESKPNLGLGYPHPFSWKLYLSFLDIQAHDI